MANFVCGNPDCSYGETGKCVLGNPIPGCKHLAQPSEPAPSGEDGPGDDAQPYQELVNLYSGMELGIEGLADLMQTRYVHLIGVLGLSESGKTCLASALYLLLSTGSLRPRYRFAGSRTLPGFESRARKARTWAGGVLPPRLAQRTELADPRSPAFLHLRLGGNHSTGTTDLAISDLPGEWSKGLSEKDSYVERHDFLRSADAMILLVDGSRIANSEEANAELHRNELILRRVAEAGLLRPAVPVAICCSKADLPSPANRKLLEGLGRRASKLGLNARVLDICAFSSDPTKIKSGTGIVELLDYVLGAAAEPWTWSAAPSDRAFLGERPSHT